MTKAKVTPWLSQMRKPFILKEQIAKISDFVWSELYRQTRWNMDNIIGLDRFGWDDDDDPEIDDDDDDEDEDDAYEC